MEARVGCGRIRMFATPFVTWWRTKASLWRCLWETCLEVSPPLPYGRGSVTGGYRSLTVAARLRVWSRLGYGGLPLPHGRGSVTSMVAARLRGGYRSLTVAARLRVWSRLGYGRSRLGYEYGRGSVTRTVAARKLDRVRRRTLGLAESGAGRCRWWRSLCRSCCR